MKLPALLAISACLPIGRIGSSLLSHPVEESSQVETKPDPVKQALDNIKTMLPIHRCDTPDVGYWDDEKPQKQHFYPFQTHKHKQNAKLQKRKKRTRYSSPPRAVRG
jgi:hypothetical protein